MKKSPIQYAAAKGAPIVQLLQEPEVAYGLDTSEYSIAEFATLSAQLGFSQSEWASILHISMRTLQRYLKDEKSFTGLQAELLHYLQKLTHTGLQLFENAGSFVQWLRQPKTVLGQPLHFQSLQSITGIRQLQQELGRIAYGVYI